MQIQMELSNFRACKRIRRVLFFLVKRAVASFLRSDDSSGKPTVDSRSQATNRVDFCFTQTAFPFSAFAF